MRDRLTARQTQLLEFLGSYIETTGYAPTVQEVCDFLQIRSKGAAHRHLRVLETKGYIQRKKHLARTIRVIPDGSPLAQPSEQPGVPFLATSQLDEETDNPWARPSDRLPREHRHLIVDPSLVPGLMDHCVAAIVGDDGLFPSGIGKGDIIVIEEVPPTDVPPGATVAVWHDRQLLVRELRTRDRGWRLHATAKSYKSRDLTPDDEAYRLLGVVHLVLHAVRQPTPR